MNAPRHAAVGIIRRADGAVFMQQRQQSQSFAGYWEFPGGKVGTGETAAAALCRELQEEIGVVVRGFRHWLRRRHCYAAGGEIVLDFFIVSDYAGTAHGREGQQWRWVFADTAPAPLLPANTPMYKWLSLPPVCAITAAEIFGIVNMLQRLRDGLQNKQWRLVQLRDKNLTAKQRRHFATAAAEMCRDHGALLLINDDESLAANAAGLHLSSRQLMKCKARPDFTWVGASCHSAAEVQKAESLQLDFAVLSPVCKTLTHVEAKPLGWENFSLIAKNCGIPLYALGGLTAEDLPHAQNHHAHGIGMMRQAWAE